MARGKKRRVGEYGDISMGKENFKEPIGRILGADTAPDTEAPERKKEPGAPSGAGPEWTPALSSKVIVRRETSGRGGRTVTVVEFRPAPGGKAAEELARSMRHGLGCGSRVEDRCIVLQGDMREKSAAWLAKRGAKNIVMGN
ncbi:MAG: translation initiation factor [Synergistaceae bacterium]|nr:translation initiation factor [Synergistaceae bacterium]